MKEPRLIRRACFAGAIAAAIAFAPHSYAQTKGLKPPQPALGPAQQVSLLSFDNLHPSLAFSQDEQHLYVVWDGVVKGSRRIFLRERIGNNWLQPVIVDTNPAGDNTMPSVAVDSAGTPHVAWISQFGTKRLPVYARRISRFPNTWAQQTVSIPSDSTVTGNCDYVQLRLDDNDRPWVVWQYGFGSAYSIACSRFDSAGYLTSEELTPGATSHNLYPELFFLPKPTVYWYLAQADQFYLIGSQYDSKKDRWSVSLPDNMENLPAQTFPDLVATSKGPLAAIWYDRLTTTGSGQSTDKVFLGIQNPETKGRGEAPPQDASTNNHSVSATVSGQFLVTSWVSESYQLGSQLYLGVGENAEALQTVQVANSPDGIISNPRLGATLSHAAIAWEENDGMALSSSEILVRVAELTR